MWRTRTTGLLFMTLGFVGCARRELTREDVLARVRQVSSMQHAVDYQFQAWTATVDASRAPVLDAYLELANRNVLVCSEKENHSFRGWMIQCHPGPEGEFLEERNGVLRFNAGTFAPSQVTGLAAVGESLVRAGVSVEFQPSTLFQRHRDIWLQLLPGFQSEIRSQAITCDFRLYDDGWRLIQ